MKRKMEEEWCLREGEGGQEEREGVWEGKAVQKMVSFLPCPLVEAWVRWHVERRYHHQAWWIGDEQSCCISEP